VAGFVLHFGGENRLAAQRRGPGQPRPLGLHADDLGVGVLGDLADEGRAVTLRHPVGRLDALIGVDEFEEARLEFRIPGSAVGGGFGFALGDVRHAHIL
jgi:hypothetical protein